MRGKSKSNLVQFLRTGKTAGQRNAELEQLKKDYPVTGNCPVLEEDGAGNSVGRCSFALRGTFCPRHGNLHQFLEPLHKEEFKGISEFKGIPESLILPREERDFGPEHLFD